MKYGVVCDTVLGTVVNSLGDNDNDVDYDHDHDEDEDVSDDDYDEFHPFLL